MKLSGVGVVGFGLFLVAAVARGQAVDKGLIDTVRPFKSYGHVYGPDSFEAMRPRIMGTHGVVATGHYLATLAGIEVLRKGGNAFGGASGGGPLLCAVRRRPRHL